MLAKQATGEPTTGVDGGNASYALQIDGEGYPFISVWDGSTDTIVSAPSPLTMGTWHHLAASRQDALLVLYVDGYEVAYDTMIGDIVYNSSLGYDMEIGSYLRNGTNEALEGLIDEVVIYSRALSAEEIRSIYESGIGGYCMPW